MKQKTSQISHNKYLSLKIKKTFKYSSSDELFNSIIYFTYFYYNLNEIYGKFNIFSAEMLCLNIDQVIFFFYEKYKQWA